MNQSAKLSLHRIQRKYQYFIVDHLWKTWFNTYKVYINIKLTYVGRIVFVIWLLPFYTFASYTLYHILVIFTDVYMSSLKQANGQRKDKLHNFNWKDEEISENSLHCYRAKASVFFGLLSSGFVWSNSHYRPVFCIFHYLQPNNKSGHLLCCALLVRYDIRSFCGETWLILKIAPSLVCYPHVSDVMAQFITAFFIGQNISILTKEAQYCRPRSKRAYHLKSVRKSTFIMLKDF